MNQSTAQTLQHEEPEIDRRDTGIRIGLTILYAIATEILNGIVGLMVVFGLVWSFITRRAPSPGLREAANRLISYDYRISRWMTWNEQEAPFPFTDFPEPLEESSWDPTLRESEDVGVRLRDEEDEDY